MGKFILILFGVYVIYYAGNIIYDLYIRKDKVVDTDETTEYAMGDFSDLVEEHIQNTTIDDVEQMNIPSGLEDNIYQEEYNNETTEQEQQENFARLQQKYEEEIKTVGNNNNENKNVGKSAKSILDNWEDFINQSETKIKMVENINGHKTYNIN